MEAKTARAVTAGEDDVELLERLDAVASQERVEVTS